MLISLCSINLMIHRSILSTDAALRPAAASCAQGSGRQTRSKRPGGLCAGLQAFRTSPGTGGIPIASSVMDADAAEQENGLGAA
jgi:hypothetical protein